MKQLKTICLTTAMLMILSGTAAFPVQAESGETEEKPRIFVSAYATEPDRSVFRLGEEPDLTGAMVNGYGLVARGTEELVHFDFFGSPLTNQELDFSEVDNTKPGTYPVYMIVSGWDAEPVRCKMLELKYVDDKTDFAELTLSYPNSSRYYEVGEPLDLKDVLLTAAGRTDGEDWNILRQPLTAYPEYVDAAGYDSTKPGDYDILVSIGGTTEKIVATVVEAIEREPGDWDRDAEITGADAQNVLNAYTTLLAGGTPVMNSEQKKAADVNGDGTIDSADAQLILLYYVQNTVAETPTDWGDLLK